jgi:hypothetical protein
VVLIFRNFTSTKKILKIDFVYSNQLINKLHDLYAAWAVTFIFKNIGMERHSDNELSAWKFSARSN